MDVLLNLKKPKVLAVAALAVASCFPAAMAKDMSVCTWLPDDHPMNAVLLAGWFDDVEKATGGAVTPRLERYPEHPRGIFDDVASGACDAGWSFHGYHPGRFILTKITEIPLLGAGAEEASAAYWDIHHEYLADGNEHDGLKLLALFTHGPGQVLMSKPIDGLDDLRGKRMRVGGGIQADIGRALGVRLVSAPGDKIYEVIDEGIVDGTFVPVGELKTLRLAEVAPYTYLMPEGMYLGSFSMFINPAYFGSLSQSEQDAIMGVSGKGLSARAGKAWHDNDAQGIKVAREAGNQVTDFSRDDQEKFAGLVGGMEKRWHRESMSRGVDTKAALDEFRIIARGN